MKLIFIRHTSVAVERGVCYGQSDVALADTFASEADAVNGRIKGLTFDRVYASPLSRCTRLAAHCGYPTHIIDRRLLEMNFGEWELKRFDEITDPRLQLWYDDYVNVRATGGESAMDQRARLESFLAELKSTCPPDSTIAIFSHGGIMIHAMALLSGLDYRDAFASLPGYGAVLQLKLN